MNFLVVSHVLHTRVGSKIYGYGPYIKEMNLWFKYVDQVTILAPLDLDGAPDPIDLAYEHSNLNFVQVPDFNVLSFGSVVKTASIFPKIWHKTWKAMKSADHIHLRCPGNMGLIGTMAQLFFPGKIKTAKYAGNWDSESKQPFTYRLQRDILSNTSLTKNMQVLVYGEWSGQSENIKPFFTASYSEKEIEATTIRSLESKEPIRLIFVGGLNQGKQPLTSVKVCHDLYQKGYDVYLDLYGEGAQRKELEGFINHNNLSGRVVLHGNVTSAEVKRAFQDSHFLIFISQSEGWPKVVAESMFWACVPITTAVSCVPAMVGYGERGVLVQPEAENVAEQIQNLIDNPTQYSEMAYKAMDWSRTYTLEKFEKEIEMLLN